jgi:hypothetical protein
MGFFDFDQAQGAYDQVYDDNYPRHEVTHEVLAGAAGFEAMRMWEHHREREGYEERHPLAKELIAGFAAGEVEKHFENGYYDHLNREQAQFAAQEQADYLYQQQYGGYGQQY